MITGLDDAIVPDAQHTARRIGGVALCVLAIVVLAIGWRSVARGRADMAAYMTRRAAQTATAEGIVVRFYSNILRSGREQPMEIIAFTTARGETAQAKTVRRGDELGRRYTVRYDPQDPRNYSLPQITDPVYSGKDAFFENTPFFLLALYFLWLAWRIRR